MNVIFPITKINGKTFPTGLIKAEHSLFTIDEDSYTDLTGSLQRPNILGERDRFDILLPMVYDDQFTAIIKEFKKSKITLEFRDFYDPNVLRTQDFYHGDLKKTWIRIEGNKSLYEQMPIALISTKIRKIDY